ncbi:hypothetical protein [Bradyrhizobium oligotrophicum]|nr:hypothetical protein [Bradyrhizobium oligotrophicum]
MASWLELLFNIIGYGGFVVIASRHHGPAPAGTAPEACCGDGTDHV